MKTALKIIAAAVMATGSLLASTAAMAAICPSSQALASFQAAPCEAGDKLYTWLSDDLPTTGAIDIEIEWTTLPNGKEIHTFSVNPSDPGAFGEGTYNLAYTIEITDPLKWFESVSIDSDVPGEAPGVEFDKDIYVDGPQGGGGSLVAAMNSSDGVPSGVFNIAATKPTKLWVYETVTVAPNGLVNSYTDTYTQSTGTAPEPGTLALLGLGLAGLAASRRRKQ